MSLPLRHARWGGVLAALLCLAAPRAGAEPAFPLLRAAGAEVAAARPAFPLAGSRGLARARPANPHGAITLSCETCHTPAAWTPLRDTLAFDHDLQAGFPLTGRHEQAACRSCHLDLRFDGPDLAPGDCASCHLDVHRNQLGSDCQSCHSTQDFGTVRGVEVHARTAFPLTGTHLQLACESCHADAADGAFAPLEADCAACHQQDFEATAGTPVDHVAADFPTTCATCHSTLAFRSGAGFDHATVSGGFTLVGAHDALGCQSCHAVPGLEPLFQPASQDDCATCHEDDHQAAHPAFPTTCATCHSTTTFAGATFDHQEATGFPLLGAHASADCASCHAGPDFAPIFAPSSAEDCQTCHADDHQTAHPSFPTTCATCHSTTTFAGASFNHQTATGFPLVGVHEALACASCHTGPDFQPLFDPAGAEDCATCHADEHQANHPTFPTTCATCHQASTWAGAAFDHQAQTGFPLAGAHQTLDCASCHTGPQFTPVFQPSGADDCATCHADDHQAAHPAFPTTCATCHSTTSFEGASFDHQATTGFPLLGAHATAACASCHAGPDFAPIFAPSSAEDCQTCHTEDHQAAHPSFPTTCQTCHSTTTFEGATFDHQAATGFPLVGVHAAVACESCHAGPEFTPLFQPSGADDCQTCHAGDHQAAHPTFPTTCATCHAPNTWEGASFDHQAVTGFPLVGVHTTVACASCHTGPDFQPRFDPAGPSDCATCHADDHRAAHPAFPTTCATCHQPDTWAGAAFDHQAATGFPLVGVHTSLTCESCHRMPDFEPLFQPASANDCATCHADEHQASHPSFPTTCTTCHQSTTWQGATFDHQAQTGFPLVGVHTALDCASCHQLPSFEPIHQPAGASDCATCHADEHQAAHPSFPTTCATCHAPNTWAGATFDHQSATGFPLVGAHVTLDCASCHRLPDFQPIFDPSSAQDCATCHADDHQAAHPTFPTTCATCHSATSFTPAAVDHPAVSGGFALVGAHATATCTSCHSGAAFEVPENPAGASDCLACHAPEHQAAHPTFPTTCATCHSTTTFAGATFNHQAATGFPLVGVHQALGCESCHTGPDFQPLFDPADANDCATCHADEHQAAHPSFPTTCATCHAPTTWAGATFNHQAQTGFPLVGAHVQLDCASCHRLPSFEPVFHPSSANDCYTCHTDEYQREHAGSGFPTTCTNCHSASTWQGAEFEHDQFFPIYSGKHEGEWSSCQTCHTAPGNFQVFSCVTCHDHRRSEMDDEHEDVRNYVYESNACYNCHPDGEDD